MVEILCFVCSSLWITRFLLELHFHWIMEYFVILKHVVYHVYHHVYCLPLCNVWEERTWNHDNRTQYQTYYIPFDRFHDNKLWVKILFHYCHGERVMVVPCMYVLNIFSKCQCFVWFVFIVIKMRQWCLECILKIEGFAKTKGFLLRRDLQLFKWHGWNLIIMGKESNRAIQTLVVFEKLMTILICIYSSSF